MIATSITRSCGVFGSARFAGSFRSWAHARVESHRRHASAARSHHAFLGHGREEELGDHPGERSEARDGGEPAVDRAEPGFIGAAEPDHDAGRELIGYWHV